MKFKFTKMHGLGNDYILINAVKYPEVLKKAPEIAPILSDRHFGVGSDGLIFADHPDGDSEDLRMRMFNSDGSESEMCGNGIRQLAGFAEQEKMIRDSEQDLRIGTLAGLKKVSQIISAHRILYRVDMGEPVFKPSEIPVSGKLNHQSYFKTELGIDDQKFELTCLSMGNPHAVIFIDREFNEREVEYYGKKIEMDQTLFPNRTNVEFIQVINPGELSMRVWERGSGETLACGTGACASLVAAHLNGLARRSAVIHLLGGDLEIEWGKDNRVMMTGPAETVFHGEIELP